jgi:hypothetical protein
MADVATHVRIFEATPSDDFVEKRIATVKDLAGRLVKPNTYDSLLGVANDLALAGAEGGTMPERLAVAVEGAIRDQSSSFVREGHALQMLVCGLLAIDQYLSAVKPSVKVVSIGDVLAVGVWSALEFQPARPEPKLETLRQEVVERARALSLQTASKARERVPIPEIKMEKPAEDMSDLSIKVKSAMGGPVEALENNAAIDREELDLLWWALSGQTDLLKGAFSAARGAAAAVASGLEGARLLRRLPADAHRNLVLRNVHEDRRLSLADLIGEIGKDRPLLSVPLRNSLITSHPAVFPLLNALLSGQCGGSGAQVPRPLGDWATRALLEAGTIRVIELHPSAKL